MDELPAIQRVRVDEAFIRTIQSWVSSGGARSFPFFFSFFLCLGVRPTLTLQAAKRKRHVGRGTPGAAALQSTHSTNDTTTDSGLHVQQQYF